MGCADLWLNNIRRAAEFDCNAIKTNRGGHWTVPELLIESKKVIPELQRLLTGG